MKQIYFILILNLLSLSVFAFEINTKTEMTRLLKEIDQDQDRKITVKDAKGMTPKFVLSTTSGKKLSVEGIYPLSNLLQELKLGNGQQITTITEKRIFENPVDRLSRSIKERYWSGLTRKIDETSLEKVLEDSKIPSDGKFYLYVPHSDPKAFNYYKNIAKEKSGLKLEVIKLPETLTAEYVEGLKLKHGLLSLALRKNTSGSLEGIPYVVPGGRFNELYGWDSYFHILGLIEDDKIDSAQDIVENFIYEIEHYGKILNANRTYYLTRSQPPFFTSMIRTVYEKLPSHKRPKKWLERALSAALKEYETVWMGQERLTVTGLSRYAGFAEGIPPEVEPEHFHYFLKPFAKRYDLSVEELVKKFNEGKIKDQALVDFFNHDRAVRESGHDTTYRWRVKGKDRASDFVTVDLNSLLYKYELDFAYLIGKYFNGEFQRKTATSFLDKAKKRKDLIRKYLWDSKKKMFFDYNWKDEKSSDYLSASTFYPLWAFDPTFPESKILTTEEAGIFVKRALKELEAQGGITATAKTSLEKTGNPEDLRQWEYPNGWAPHQMLLWRGLLNYNLKSDAKRLIYKWLYLLTKNARDYNGTIPEKYDVVNMSHDVFAEYGNVGTKFDYITTEGFGWMNASYVYGLKLLGPHDEKKLKKMIPAEWLTF